MNKVNKVISELSVVVNDDYNNKWDDSDNEDGKVGPPLLAKSTGMLSYKELQEVKRSAQKIKLTGNKFLRKKKYNVAYHYFTGALQMHPDNPTLYCNRSTCQFAKKLYVQSFEDSCEAIDLDPLQDRGFQNAINVLAHFSFYNLATEVANIALEFDKDNRNVFVTWINEGYFKSTLKQDEDEKNSLLCTGFKQRLKNMRHFDKIRNVNIEFEVNKDYGKVLTMCHELLDEITVPVIANAYYYCSFCYHYLTEKELAYNTVNMCLSLYDNHSPGKRLKEYLDKFYTYKDKGFLSFVEGEYKHCVRWYRKIFELNRNDKNTSLPFHFLMGLTRRAQKKYSLAIKCFSEAIESQQSVVQSYFWRAEMYQALGKIAKAQSDYSKAAEILKSQLVMEEFPSKSDLSHTFLTEAALYLCAGRLETGVDHYKLAFMCHPNDFETTCLCNAALFKVRKYKEVVALSRKARELRSDYGVAYLEEGQCLIVLGRVDEAIITLENARLLLPEDHEAKAAMGRALSLKEFLEKGKAALKNENLEAAEMYFTEARVLAYTDKDLLKEIVSCKNQLASLNNTKTPVTDLRGIISDANAKNRVVLEDIIEGMTPADVSYVNGTFAYYKCEKDVALDHFKTALKHDPNHEMSQVSVKIVESVFKTYEEATQYLGKEDSTDWEIAEQLFIHGFTLDYCNTRVQAIFHHGLGETYFKMGSYKEALIEFSRAINCYDEYDYAYAKRGDCQCALHRYKEALEDYSCAIDLDPCQEYKLSYKKAHNRLKAIQKSDSKFCSIKIVTLHNSSQV